MSKLPVLYNAQGQPIKNSLADVAVQMTSQRGGIGGGLGGFNLTGANAFGFPGGYGSEQISQPNTTFKNLRWYLISNFRQVLNEIYAELGLVRVICDVPVDDALRGGVKVNSKELDENEILELMSHVDAMQDFVTVGQAAKWNRLFGGAGILIMSDQDPLAPFDIEKIKQGEDIQLKACDIWELFWDKQDDEGYSVTLQDEEAEYFDYYGEQVARSRVLALKGIEAPSFIRPRLRGWGLSVVETLIRSLNQYLKSNDLLFEVLDEFKLDIYRMQGLIQTLMLGAEGENDVVRRITVANYLKNYQNALVLDKEDEYQQKQLSFTGIAEALREIRMGVAADMRMPLSKLFGISASGFNSGEDDIEVYNGMVESEVRNKIKYPILEVLKIRCQQLFGFVPEDMTIEFEPLRVLSAEQEETVKTQQFARVTQALQLGLIDAKTAADACNKHNLIGVMIDTETLQLGGFEDDAVTEEGSEGNPDDNDTERVKTGEGKAKSSGGKNNPKDPPQGEPPRAKFSMVINSADNSLGYETALSTLTKVSVKKWTRKQKFYRLLENSAEFDRRAFEADGGAQQMRMDLRGGFFDRDKAKDKALWDRATGAAHRAGYTSGTDEKAFTVWFYAKYGGEF